MRGRCGGVMGGRCGGVMPTSDRRGAVGGRKSKARGARPTLGASGYTCRKDHERGNKARSWSPATGPP
jgi:hypothetical protein